MISEVVIAKKFVAKLALDFYYSWLMSCTLETMQFALRN